MKPPAVRLDGQCSACDVAPQCQPDNAKGRLAAVALALIIAFAAIPLWFMSRGGGGSSAEAGLSPTSAVTAVAQPEILLAANVAVAPMICRPWPMPHEPRGACANCHTVVDCPAGGAQSAQAAPPPFALPTITRNSLLPHQFAGACMHCHFIVEQGPTPVNRDNMESLPLSEPERALVHAGQQVIPPSVLTRMSAPLLGYGTILPHIFWGVCSNCHRVVDFGFGRGPTASQEQLALARTLLVRDGMSEFQIANATTNAGRSVRSVASWLFGILALGFFLVSMVYVAMKVYLGSKPESDQKRLRHALNIKKWFRIHEWTSFGFGGAVVLHWLFSELGSALLHISLLLVVALTLSGILYRYKVPSLASKTSLRWIHSQRSLLYALIVTAVLGHLFVFLMP